MNKNEFLKEAYECQHLRPGHWPRVYMAQPWAIYIEHGVLEDGTPLLTKHSPPLGEEDLLEYAHDLACSATEELLEHGEIDI